MPGQPIEISAISQEIVYQRMGEALKSIHLSNDVTKQVNKFADLFHTQPNDKLVTYLPERQRPFPGTQVTDIRGQYTSELPENLPGQVLELFNLEVDLPDLGTSIISFSRISGETVNDSRFHFFRITDQTHKKVDLEDDVRILGQTLEVLKQINFSTMTEASKDWLTKFKEGRAYRQAQKQVEGQLRKIVDRKLPPKFKDSEYSQELGPNLSFDLVGVFNDDDVLIENVVGLHYASANIDEVKGKQLVIAFRRDGNGRLTFKDIAEPEDEVNNQKQQWHPLETNVDTKTKILEEATQQLNQLKFE